MEFVQKSRENETVIVAVKGRIDAVAASDFEQQMSDLLAQGEKRIVLDMSELEFISSAGLRSILVMVKKLKGQDGGLALAAMTPTVLKVFKLSGFAAILPLSDTVESALEQI